MKRKRFKESDYENILMRQGRKCAICGHAILPWQRYDRDHVIPLAAGGNDEIENIQIVHHSCHVRKTADDMRVIAKVNRIRKGGNKRKGKAIAGSRDSGWKCRLTGAGNKWERRR